MAQPSSTKAVNVQKSLFNPGLYQGTKWRNVGPFRGGRSVAVHGVPSNPLLYYMGSTGGGLWKTSDGGIHWHNVSDGFFATGSVGAIAVAASDPNILYVAMGEHAVRGVMTSEGDGVYKSTDAGRTWAHIGLPNSRHIAAIRIHPTNPDLVFVAVQGALYGASEDRGVYRSANGGKTWVKTLYVDDSTGASDLSISPHNPRVLYAGLWDHRREPWAVRSGGPGSGLYRSTDGGENWEKLQKGLPASMGKVAVAVSPANPDVVYANIEADKGGVYRSDDGGATWRQTSSDRATIARAWYYTEIVADPQNPETVYVLNAPLLKSTDGGRTFKPVHNPHTDQHDLWINPANPANMILANDGGACITFNGAQSWSSQDNQPTAQFYRVIADNRFPYHIYAGQQDNSTLAIASRNDAEGIGAADWYPVAGGESAFIAFDPNDPTLVYGGSYQGNISVYDHRTRKTKDVMAYPTVGLAARPRDMKYRFNWNAPIVASPQNPKVIYHAANVVLRTQDGGINWTAISPDLTKNEALKQGLGGRPYTNEGAGGENYNTISYLACSPHEAGTIWAGSDDGLLHLTRDGGQQWANVTPPSMGEAIINSVEVSPHQPGTAYVAALRYKFDDPTPYVYVTENYGASWRRITEGIGRQDFVRVVREDPLVKGLLYAGTERGLYVSMDSGTKWQRFQGNLPMCPINDLAIHDNDLIAATSGRGFWILDDLGAVQQNRGTQLLNGQMVLFQPKPSFRFDAPDVAQPPKGMGQNPLAGVIIDYYLPRTMDSLELKIQILDAAGKVVRTYPNQDDPAYKAYPGGPPAVKRLPTQRGINRFNWDMRRELLSGVADVFMLGDYRGSMVPPGDYTIRLIAPFSVVEQTCRILPDPRLSATPEEYAAQDSFLKETELLFNEMHATVRDTRLVGQQVKATCAQLAAAGLSPDLVKMSKDILGKLDLWERRIIQPDQKTFQDVINYPNQLNAELADLRQRVDTHEPQLTAGAHERLADIKKAWQMQKGSLSVLLNQDVAAFNRSYMEKQLPTIIVPQWANSYEP